MNVPKILKPGTTSGRKAFWDSIAETVEKLQKKAGRNVSVNQHQGYGTIINVNRERGSPGDTGACCVGTDCSITTADECFDLGGEFQGVGSTCFPNPCECNWDVHADVCLQWYPDGPEVDCVIDATGSVDTNVIFLECPIDYETVGRKIRFEAPLVSSATGAECGGVDVSDCTVKSCSSGLSWNPGTNQWLVTACITLPHYPGGATFSYGPTFVTGEDLTTAGPITIVDEGCPSGGDPDNPNATIVLTFS